MFMKNSETSQIGFFSAGLSNRDAHVPAGCPPNWSQHEDNCLFFERRPMNWQNADANCKAMGATLLTTLGSNDIAMAQAFARTLHDDSSSPLLTWLSANDLNEARDFRWGLLNKDFITVRPGSFLYEGHR